MAENAGRGSDPLPLNLDEVSRQPTKGGGHEGMIEMTKWVREGYTVEEVHAGQFEVVKDNGYLIGTIVTDGAEDRNRIAADLDAGEDVDGWEDGNGNTIDTDWGDEDDFREMIRNWQFDNAPDYDDLVIESVELEDRKWVAVAHDEDANYTLTDGGTGNIAIHSEGKREGKKAEPELYVILNNNTRAPASIIREYEDSPLLGELQPINSTDDVPYMAQEQGATRAHIYEREDDDNDQAVYIYITSKATEVPAGN